MNAYPYSSKIDDPIRPAIIPLSVEAPHAPRIPPHFDVSAIKHPREMLKPANKALEPTLNTRRRVWRGPRVPLRVHRGSSFTLELQKAPRGRLAVDRGVLPQGCLARANLRFTQVTHSSREYGAKLANTFKARASSAWHHAISLCIVVCMIQIPTIASTLWLARLANGDAFVRTHAGDLAFQPLEATLHFIARAAINIWIASRINMLIVTLRPVSVVSRRAILSNALRSDLFTFAAIVLLIFCLVRDLVYCVNKSLRIII